MATSNNNAEALIPQFKFEKLLNQDQAGRRIVLQGTIANQPALLLAERAAFDADESHLSTFTTSLSHIQNLGDNDIYRWYMAHSGAGQGNPPDLKINLIYPC
ncbi:hypothetical protein KCU98_g22141, partial [Aureobasidium melanogenum]